MNSIALQASGPVSPIPTVTGTMDIVRAALETGNIELYREAAALAKELDAIAARKAFDNAIADAKAEIPVIRKNRTVDFNSTKGRTHGLNYRYRIHNKPNEPIVVTCHLSHRAGHFEDVEMCGPPDDSGNKNTHQKAASAVTYLQRYTLKAALGLAAAEDDDARATEAETEIEAYAPPPGSITQEQADELRDALEAKGISSKAFLQWAGQKKVEEIPADQFESCKEAIKNHQGGQK
jgi:hypothetical protein